MKTLYVNLDNKQIKSTETIEVLNYNLLGDFFYYLGEAIVEDLDFHANKISLIEDFNTTENASDFDEILKQWEELKSILFGEKPEGIFEITLSNGYIDWLRYNSNDEYRKIYSLKYSNNDRNVISIDIDDFYTSCIKGDLLRKIKSKVCKINMSFDEIVIGIKAIHSSLFAREIKEILKVKIVAGELEIDNTFLLASVKDNNQWITIDVHGNHIESFKHVLHSSFNDGLTPVCEYDKWGFIDTKGNLKIPCIYKYVKSFSEGLAPVEFYTKDGFKYVFIDVRGNQVIPNKYDYAESFNDGLAVVGCNGKYGFIDVRGNLVTPNKYDEAKSFNNGLALVRYNKKYGFIDVRGNFVILNRYDYAGSFNNGLAVVKCNGKYGYIDKSFQLVIPCVYDEAISFSEGLAAVKNKDKYGFIDIKGNQVVPCIYDEVYNSANLYTYYRFSNGLARVKKTGKWGFIDKRGNEVIPCMYEMAFDFCKIS